MNHRKINEVSPQEDAYAKVLASIAIPPKKLYIRGKLPEKRQISVAVVGTRKPTPYGTEVTQRIAGELARKGVIIVSGLALGIDAIAHKAALREHGTTIAVLGNGVAEITPHTNAGLGREIIEQGGAVLSEYEPSEPAYPAHFLERNRLVSGLSDAVIVTEAALRSGTMSTVAHALEQGKEVFAVPGPLTSPMSAGCNAMIKQGAHIVTSVDDILEVIAPELLHPLAQTIYGDTPSETAIIALLQGGVRDGDELLSQSALSTSEYNQVLTMLEIRGIIRPLGANQWTLV